MDVGELGRAAARSLHALPGLKEAPLPPRLDEFLELLGIPVDKGQQEVELAALEERGQFAHRQTRKDRVVGQERVLMFALSAAT